MNKLIKISFLAIFCFSHYSWADVEESRAIFDESFSWKTPEGTDKLLLRIKRAGFNVLIPRVWVGEGTYWPSKIAPVTRNWNIKAGVKYDPLENLIIKAHALGIEVHPWFTVMTRWRKFYNQFYDSGTPKNAFDVHNPEFRHFIVELMLEVVKKYDVDGINLDVIRSRGFCRSRSCQLDYQIKFGRDLLKDLETYHNTNHFIVEQTEAWSVLREWNRQAVSDIVRKFSDQAKVISPELIVSVDTIVLIEDFNIQGADAILWANKGWVDVIYQMDYVKKPRLALLKKAREKLNDKQSLVLLTGNVDWPEDDQGRGKEAFSRNPQLTANLLDLSRNLWVGGNGVAMWTYGFLTEEQINSIASGPFREPAFPGWF